MTFRDGTAPSRPLAALASPAASGAFGLALLRLRRLFHARPPSAQHLSDRRLADIGLTRADLPDHRGWRR